jgi:hypothetical protein
MSEKIAPSDRSQNGPFDSNEIDLPAGFLDFGALKVVTQTEIGVRLEIEEATGRVVAVSIDLANSTLQVSVFAAPKLEGVWSDVLDQLRASITEAGGAVDEYIGQLGVGLNAKVKQPDGSLRNMRFIGVDGPRWFLRGTITGAALTDLGAAAEVEDFFRSLVVDRGDSPMPPKEPLNLVLPAGVIAPPRIGF